MTLRTSLVRTSSHLLSQTETDVDVMMYEDYYEYLSGGLVLFAAKIYPILFKHIIIL